MASKRKKVLLATDGRTNVQVDALADSLNRVCKHLRFAHHPPIPIPGFQISNPKSYASISKLVKPLLPEYSLILIATELPYDNNFFWDAADGAVVIISFSNWPLLTNLSMNNGLVGFINSILA